MRPLLPLLLLGYATASLAAFAPDKITSLPGLSEKPNFDMYSGYLPAYDDNYFHYWFVESQGTPSKDPLILWLGSGPGCSALDGFLNQHGPFRPNHDGTELETNPHSWNTFANVLFIDSPECTGFSYNSKGVCKSSDTQNVMRNYYALLAFHVKFPEYHLTGVTFTGEGYAGFSAPTLANFAYNQKKNYVNVSGVAIGNGYSNYDKNDNSLFFYAYYHGIFDQRFWDKLVQACCDGKPTRDCRFKNTRLDACYDVMEEATNIIRKSGVNRFNLYEDCLHPKSSSSETSVDHDDIFDYMSNLGTHGDPPCTDYSAMYNYLNRADVKAALHVKKDLEWRICTDKLNYRRSEHDMSMTYDELLYYFKRVLIFNGDVDMSVNYLGNEWFVNAMERMDLVKERHIWKVGGQVAGFAERFKYLAGGTVDLLTLRGAGHFSPRDKPAEALHMMRAFVNNQEF